MTFATTNSWAEFEASLAPLGKKAKGDAFERLTYWFFLLNEVHASQYEEVWLWADVPQQVKEELNLPDQDLGIDLLLKKGTEYHAVQCKYHTDHHANVSFREVATFLSVLESNDRISLGYICSSANGMTANFEKVSKNTKQIQRILSDTWNRLDETFFKRLRKAQSGAIESITPYQPREHQRKAIEAASNHFVKEGNDRGKLIFPCGAGKSLTGYWMIDSLGAKNTLVAVPSLSLVKQTIEVYLRECAANGQKVKWICICSDEGIGRGDDVVMYHNDLGVPCETNLDSIETWLQDNADDKKVVFTTYQSGRVIAEAARNCDVQFDVGIFDEAHKTVGAKDKLFSHLLFEENIQIKHRIFMTATERFYAGSKDDIISMDDDEVYGETFTQMTFKEAIELELLTDYKVVTIEVQESEVAKFIQENNLIELNAKWGKETEARSLASMLALRKAMKRFPIRNAVSFHSSIDKAKRNKELQTYITDSYDYQPIDTFTVSGKVPTTKRNEIVQEFARSEHSLITNARCLTEGVDVPNIDCIVFADPRKSKVDIVQALGRALRKKDGKEWGYVVLPVIYDEETGEIDNENFNEILAVVRGLASNDERIIEHFKDKNQPEKNRKTSDSGDQFQFEVFSDHIDESQLSEQLDIRLWDNLGRYVWMSFAEARDFAHALELKKKDDWFKWLLSNNLPSGIPKAPSRVYNRNGWLGWGDFLGTGSIANQNREFVSYSECSDYALKQGIKSGTEWREFCKSGARPSNIPSNPQLEYKENGWKGWGNFLRTGSTANQNREFLPFAKARDYIRELGLQTWEDWYSILNNLPENIPKAPNITYCNEGWIDMKDWLGSKVMRGQSRFLDFEEARRYTRKQGFTSTSQWDEFRCSDDFPEFLPQAPHDSYKETGWQGIGDFLGTGSIANQNREFVSYSECSDYALKQGIKSRTEWREFCKSGARPSNIPSNPQLKYKENGWKGWGDFLRTLSLQPQMKKFLNYESARNKMRPFGLSTRKEWRLFVDEGNRPADIPGDPYKKYKNKGWISWPHFLGKD